MYYTKSACNALASCRVGILSPVGTVYQDCPARVCVDKPMHVWISGIFSFASMCQTLAKSNSRNAAGSTALPARPTTWLRTPMPLSYFSLWMQRGAHGCSPRLSVGELQILPAKLHSTAARSGSLLLRLRSPLLRSPLLLRQSQAADAM
jgi:hypothetical protein